MKRIFKKETFPEQSKDLVPGQALDLVDLWNRYNRGQRLLVNQRPINIYDIDEDGNFVDPDIKDENYSNVLPDIDDPVDLEEYLEETQEEKRVLKEKIEKSKKHATPPSSDLVEPPTPSKDKPDTDK